MLPTSDVRYHAGDDDPYYCGWAITYRATTSHLIASRKFPTAGSICRAWCGELVIVIGLTLNARDPRPHCVKCNWRLRYIANTHDCDLGRRL